jgi:hypothetical protein
MIERKPLKQRDIESLTVWESTSCAGDLRLEPGKSRASSHGSAVVRGFNSLNAKLISSLNSGIFFRISDKNYGLAI